jgi:predicted RNase H-like HicB family nuclease
MSETPRYEIDIFWSAEDDAYIANVPELEYCSAWGETYEGALREARVAMDLYLDTLREDGRTIPEPIARNPS